MSRKLVVDAEKLMAMLPHKQDSPAIVLFQKQQALKHLSAEPLPASAMFAERMEELLREFKEEQETWCPTYYIKEREEEAMRCSNLKLELDVLLADIQSEGVYDSRLTGAAVAPHLDFDDVNRRRRRVGC